MPCNLLLDNKFCFFNNIGFIGSFVDLWIFICGAHLFCETTKVSVGVTLLVMQKSSSHFTSCNIHSP